MKSNIDKFYNPVPIDYTKSWVETKAIYDSNWKQITDSDDKGKLDGTILGRYYQEQRGDGYAIYIVTAIGKTKCTLEWCNQIGDDWQVPMLADIGTASISVVTQNIKRREGLAKLFRLA